MLLGVALLHSLRHRTRLHWKMIMMMLCKHASCHLNAFFCRNPGISLFLVFPLGMLLTIVLSYTEDNDYNNIIFVNLLYSAHLYPVWWIKNSELLKQVIYLNRIWTATWTFPPFFPAVLEILQPPGTYFIVVLIYDLGWNGMGFLTTCFV